MFLVVVNGIRPMIQVGRGRTGLGRWALEGDQTFETAYIQGACWGGWVRQGLRGSPRCRMSVSGSPGKAQGGPCQYTVRQWSAPREGPWQGAKGVGTPVFCHVPDGREFGTSPLPGAGLWKGSKTVRTNTRLQQGAAWEQGAACCVQGRLQGVHAHLQRRHGSGCIGT